MNLKLFLDRITGLSGFTGLKPENVQLHFTVFFIFNPVNPENPVYPVKKVQQPIKYNKLTKQYNKIHRGKQYEGNANPINRCSDN